MGLTKGSLPSLLAILPLISGQAAYGLEFAIPSSPPSNSSSLIDSTPLGVSLEFFAFPDYIEKVPLTNSCLSALGEVFGTPPPMRIGGTTQDRATYNASLSLAVSYTVASPDDAPDSLTFGDKFMDLAAGYDGKVTIGVNRRLDDIDNTIAAAKVIQSKLQNLYAIELGNEPNFFESSDPIAHGNAWTAEADAESQVSWQSSVSKGLGDLKDFVQAGVFFDLETFTISYLVEKEENTDSTQYVHSFCHHYYPQSSPSFNLSKLMDHTTIVDGVLAFEEQVRAAEELQKDLIMGETNSATQGGGGISPTYGAGLWILDYMMQATILGVKQLFFHQGTIGNCQYCWWNSNNTVNAPFYGAYFAALALANASQVAQLDSGDTRYAAYVIYDADSKPSRVLLYNSDYYTEGTRGSVDVTLTALSGDSVSVKRLTGDAATTTVEDGKVTIAGQAFTGETCGLSGSENVESVQVDGGVGSFSVGASEALLVYL
ncbi:hypothetical protein ASPWEDRAFT_617099 [Aspergillus wentii DTO 134E9]|uniref:Beta-glucuronidase C-terminal domain-containing protein n=1 Tax=Aspergillus wentii DTO 134E9 TaxID=1073089 RepID=A0A1L9REE9_ASPWE|nr:uncharacterized protein ASPWEDRAFT_617099 [Aspergillus wentii DTO 134E9]KAI9933512.1 hypothetical protein MW887_007985 [Aspergillus wentii]OJJ33258.1 hypothetical protein ASPWEDRAFT_617099 [Aspergillus wentii DTO 134E9]